MKHIFVKKKLFLLGFVALLYMLVITPLLIINIQKQQDLRGRAQEDATVGKSETTNWIETQTAQSLCVTTGETQIGVAFTNTDTSRSINVTAKDEISGKAVSLGIVGPEETATATIDTAQKSIPDGTVTFTQNWTDTTGQLEQKTATYIGRTCENAETAFFWFFHRPKTPTPIQSGPTPTVKQPTPVPNGPSCGNVAMDIVLIIDKSGSMGNANKLVQAKNAANNFINIISQDTRNRIGLVSFSTKSSLESGLTTNYEAVKSEVKSLKASGYTCQECGIKTTNSEIASNGRPGIKKVVILLTDGQANWIEGGIKQTSTSTAETKAYEAVQQGFASQKTVFFTVGLGELDGRDDGKLYSSQFLQKISALTGGKYYFPAPNELDSVYQSISQIIGQGMIGGYIFNDANNNAVYDQNEQKLSGWTVTATSGSTSKTATSTSTGEYSLTGLCEGTYTVKQTMKPGWKQTVPASSNGYSINITNGSSYSDRHFGNIVAKPRCSDGVDNDNNGVADAADPTCHTDGNPKNPSSYDPNKDGENGGNTCADGKDNNGNNLYDGADPVCHTDKNPNNPGSYDPNLPEKSIETTFDLTVYQHGIGMSGDNTNPNETSLSNKNPNHKTISADLQLFDLSNNLIGSGTGFLTYNAKDGNYTGTMDIYPHTFPTGKYYLKVRTQYHLRKLMSGIQTITAGQNNTGLPAVTVIAGDILEDNKINILDYNLLLGCYSDLAAAAACDPQKKIASDLTDDNSVNQIDYNLFLREIATQPGE